jgi:hypothetical protein
MPSGWRSRVELIVEVGLRGAAGGTFQWDVSDWDEQLWGGVEPTWADLEASEVRSVTTQRGRRAGARERHRTGTATVVLWWTAPEGRWLFKPTTPVRLGQELRLRARVDGGDPIPIYRGTINELRDAWDPVGPYEVTANLVDRKADLAAVDLPEEPVEGLGDTTDARLARIITEKAGIDEHYLRLATSSVEHASSNFARNLLDEAEVAVEGENGAFYVDREGYFVFRPRGWHTSDTRAIEEQQTWTNVEGDPLAVHPMSFGTYQSARDLTNEVTMARVGGTAYTVVDADSQLVYGRRTYPRMDLTLRFDADVEATADELLEQLRDRTEGLGALTGDLHPRASLAWLEGLLDVELGDRHEVVWDDGSGDLYAEAHHVQGVGHTVTPEAWRVNVDLWHYTEPPAQWGTAVWGLSEWS